MTFQIRQSLIANVDEFGVQVAAFAKEQRDWLERKAKVKEEEGRDDIAPIDRHHMYPRPTAHELVVQAVNDDGSPDYELIDDTLGLRKLNLINSVASAANEAIGRLISPAKLNAATIRLSDIARDDNARRLEVQEKYIGLLQRLKIKRIDQDAIERDVVALRSDDDNRLLADMDEMKTAIDVIHRKLVQAHSDIEDLRLETIGSYQLPEF